MEDFTLTRVRLLSGENLEEGKVSVSGGVVDRIGSFAGHRGREIDCGGLVAFPALVDNHVHFREPGAEEKEGFETGSAAAAHGGAGTVLEVQNSPPLLATPDLLRAKRALAAAKSRVNIGFYGSAVWGILDHFEEMASSTAGLKLFMAPSHGDEGFASEEAMRPFFAACARWGCLMVVHAEDGGTIARAAGRAGPVLPENFGRIRPPEAEIRAVERAIELARDCGTRLHVFHVSTAGAVDRIADARREGLDVSASTCPHYLYFTGEDTARLGALLKCYPSIKSARDRDRLFAALKEGVIEIVSTDHAPHLPAEKILPFGRAPAGISSSDLFLPLMTTLAARGLLALSEIAVLCCRNPAGIHRLVDAGLLDSGRSADIVLFDPDARWTVRRGDFLSKASLSPYLDMELTGRVAATLVGGKAAYVDPSGPLRGFPIFP